MSAVSGGVDQPTLPSGVDHAVASPEIAVEPRRRFISCTELVESLGEGFELFDCRLGEGIAVACKLGERAKALLGVELSPRVARVVR